MSEKNTEDKITPFVPDKENNYVPTIAPKGFIHSALDSFSNTALDWMPELGSLATEGVAKVTGSAPIENVANRLNEFNLKHEFGEQLNAPSLNRAGTVTGEVAGFVAPLAASLATSGLSIAGEATAVGGGSIEAAELSQAAKATSESIASSEGESASVVKNSIADHALEAGEAENWLKNGIVPKFTKYNAYNAPFLLGTSAHATPNGVQLNSKQLMIGALFANALPLAGRAINLTRYTLTKLGARRLDRAYDSSLDTEIPNTEQEVSPEPSSPKSKANIVDALPNDEKEFLDKLAQSPDKPVNEKDGNNIITQDVQVLPENANEYTDLMLNPTHKSILWRNARNAILSRGILLDGKKVIPGDIEAQAKIEDINNKFNAFDKQKGVRQVYLNQKVQHHFGNETNTERLNALDKRLFDAVPYNSAGAAKASSIFMKSEKTGYRTFGYPEWFRVAKKERDNEALQELTTMAKSGNKTAQYLHALYNQSMLSEGSRATKLLLNHIVDAFRNPIAQDDINNVMEKYHTGNGDHYAGEYDANIESAKDELENADYSKFSDKDSPHYIKLIGKLKSDKFITYVHCMLGE